VAVSCSRACAGVGVDEAVRWRAGRPERGVREGGVGLYFEDEPRRHEGAPGARAGRGGPGLASGWREVLERRGGAEDGEGMRREAARWVRRAREEMGR